MDTTGHRTCDYIISLKALLMLFLMLLLMEVSDFIISESSRVSRYGKNTVGVGGFFFNQSRVLLLWHLLSSTTTQYVNNKETFDNVTSLFLLWAAQKHMSDVKPIVPKILFSLTTWLIL